MKECSSKQRLPKRAINSSCGADFLVAALVEAPDECQPSPVLFDLYE
jgi:hypothetical protein